MPASLFFFRFLFLFAVLFSVPLLRCLWNKFGVTSGGEVIHEYSDLVATKVSWICNAVLIYLLTQVVVSQSGSGSARM